MAKQSHGNLVKAIRKIALSYPEAEEGVACAGTAVEKTTFKARGKAYLFKGVNADACVIIIKLRESLLEAAQRHDCKVGANGWVTATFRADEPPPPGLLERWIDESYRLLVPKSLVAMLDGAERAALPKPKKTARKKRR